VDHRSYSIQRLCLGSCQDPCQARSHPPSWGEAGSSCFTRGSSFGTFVW
jgi:hypothetical protein